MDVRNNFILRFSFDMGDLVTFLFEGAVPTFRAPISLENKRKIDELSSTKDFQILTLVVGIQAIKSGPLLNNIVSYMFDMDLKHMAVDMNGISKRFISNEGAKVQHQCYFNLKLSRKSLPKMKKIFRGEG